MILGSELELEKVKTALSKHLGILPKIRGEAVVLRFGSEQLLQEQSFSTWFDGPVCSVVVL